MPADRSPSPEVGRVQGASAGVGFARSRPRLLDLFCGAGGASMGYSIAGFEVVGVDIEPHPDYPFEFHQDDAIEWLEMLYDDPSFIAPFDAIHASPVCHDWSALASVTGKNGTGDLLHKTLEKLPRLGLPWVVENVPGAPLADRSDLFGRHGVELCGTMFELKVLRHRIFETSFPIDAPRHGSHVGEFYAPAGHGDPNWKRRDANPHLSGPGYADRCREAMGIDWMNRDDLAQAIPPAYTEYVGGVLLEHMRTVRLRDLFRRMDAAEAPESARLLSCGCPSYSGDSGSGGV